jgi:hypothetical protein
MTRCNPGAKCNAVSGKAKPSASATKIKSVVAADWVSTAPMAPAIKGAVQGVAATTASAPVKKAPASPPRSAAFALVFCNPPPISNTPSRLRPIAKNRSAKAAVTSGDCNWNPHPTASPALRNAIKSAARPRKVARTPAA